MVKSRKKKVEEPKVEFDINVPDMIHFMPCEWMIQFDDDEPQLFPQSDDSSQNHEVVIKLQNTNHAYINFTDSKTGKSFKMFARQKQ